MSVCSGHCRERKLTAKERRSFPFICGCEKWESDEEIKENRKQNIAEVMADIRNHLCQIEQILLQDSEG